MKNRLCVKKRTLLLLAGLVWLTAGFNVARMGVLSYLNVSYGQWLKNVWKLLLEFFIILLIIFIILALI